MTAQTGRSNAKHIGVHVDNSSGTLTDISGYVDDVGSVGTEFETTDVTAYSDGIRNVTIGRPMAPLAFRGKFDTVIHNLLSGIVGGVTPLSLDVRFGIRHAWEAGEPQFGITSSSTSGYLCTSYKVNPNDQTWNATFEVFGSTAPAWGTAAET